MGGATEKKPDLEALFRAYPAPWKVWTSCSFRRVSSHRGGDGDVLYGGIHRDGKGSIESGGSWHGEDVLNAIVSTMNAVASGDLIDRATHEAEIKAAREDERMRVQSAVLQEFQNERTPFEIVRQAINALTDATQEITND